MTKDEVLATLRVLARLERPVWLAGGVAVDFHVGRWTRDHDDIDLVTFEEHRDGLDQELPRLGFRALATGGGSRTGRTRDATPARCRSPTSAAWTPTPAPSSCWRPTPASSRGSIQAFPPTWRSNASGASTTFGSGS